VVRKRARRDVNCSIDPAPKTISHSCTADTRSSVDTNESLRSDLPARPSQGPSTLTSSQSFGEKLSSQSPALAPMTKHDRECRKPFKPRSTQTIGSSSVRMLLLMLLTGLAVTDFVPNRRGARDKSESPKLSGVADESNSCTKLTPTASEIHFFPS
jgi:hypothetical protein